MNRVTEEKPKYEIEIGWTEEAFEELEELQDSEVEEKEDEPYSTKQCGCF